MKYTKKDLGSYNLHLINTDKFKTITVRVIFHTPIKKEEITKRSVLADLLLQSSSKYDTRRKMTIEAEELYSADIMINNQRLGNYVVTSFDLQVLMDKYTEENTVEKAIEYLSEIILNPDVLNNKFKKDKLDYVKHNTKLDLESIKEDTSYYSLIRLYESYDKDSPVSYRVMGYVDDLDKIDESNIYTTYNKMINNDYVDIFVVGNYDNKEMLAMIKKYFKFKKIKKKKESYLLKNKKPRRRKLVVKETIDNKQSNLVIACPIDKLTPYERNYVLPISNIIFGGNPDSKLFREVREANSLCYTIYSNVSRLDNLLTISSGIDRSNYNKALDLIIKKLDDMKKAKFSEDDINTAKMILKSSLDEIEENPNRMIGEVLNRIVFNIEDIDERIELIQKVKKQDIVKLCKKIHIDTVFLLEGVANEED